MMKPISVWKQELAGGTHTALSLIHISEPTRH